jgi:hypothetical protein
MASTLSGVTVQFVGQVSFAVKEILTVPQVEMSTRQTIATKLAIAKSSVTATATKTSSRRLVTEELLRQLAGANTWKVDWTATVPKASETIVASIVQNITTDKDSIAASLKTNLEALVGVGPISSLNVTVVTGSKKSMSTEASRAPCLSGKFAVGIAVLMSTLGAAMSGSVETVY